MGNCTRIFNEAGATFLLQNGFSEITNTHSSGQLEFIDQIIHDCLIAECITYNHSVVSGPWKFEFGLKSGVLFWQAFCFDVISWFIGKIEAISDKAYRNQSEGVVVQAPFFRPIALFRFNLIAKLPRLLVCEGVHAVRSVVGCR